MIALLIEHCKGLKMSCDPNFGLRFRVCACMRVCVCVCLREREKKLAKYVITA
jgi:hypothetical protein